MPLRDAAESESADEIAVEEAVSASTGSPASTQARADHPIAIHRLRTLRLRVDVQLEEVWTGVVNGSVEVEFTAHQQREIEFGHRDGGFAEDGTGEYLALRINHARTAANPHSVDLG